MRCLVCECFTLSLLCNQCKTTFLQPSFHTRTIDSIPVYSFYAYDEIDRLLKYKHQPLGARVYAMLCALTLPPFIAELDISVPVAVVAVDDHVRHEFSHSAALLKPFKHKKGFFPQFGALPALSHEHYASQSLEYRVLHSRNFKVNAIKQEVVIVVDDIVTTGQTLHQAITALQNARKTVLCAITLATVLQ